MKLPLGIGLDDIVKHTVIAGATGCGKSMEMLNIYLSALKHPSIKTIMFIIEGRELGVLPLLESKDVLVLQCGKNYRHDLLGIVEGSDNPVSDTTDDFCHIMMDAFFLGERSYGMMKPLVKEIVEDKVNQHGKGLQDLYDSIRKSIRKGETWETRQAKEKVLNRLDIILDCETFSTVQPLNMNLLLNTHIMVDMSSLEIHSQIMLTISLLYKTFRRKKIMREQYKNTEDQLVNLAIIDEIQRLTPAVSSVDNTHFGIFELLASAGRKYGLGTLTLLQRPSTANASFLSQADLTLFGNLSHLDDVRIVEKLAGLSSEQSQFFRDQLGPRRFIAKKSSCPAFVLESPELNIRPEVIDDDFISNWNRSVLSGNQKLEALQYQKKKNPGGKKIPEIIVDEKDPIYILLSAVSNYPCFPISYYVKMLSDQMKLQKFYQLKEKAEEVGYLVAHKILTGKRYLVGLELTEKACEKFGLEKLTFSKGANFLHTYIAENIKRFYEKKGSRVVKEKRIGEHFVDLYVEEDNLAIEIAIGNKPDYEIQNIAADLQEAEKVLVIGNDKKHLEKIEKLLPEEIKVEFKLFHEFSRKSK